MKGRIIYFQLVIYSLILAFVLAGCATTPTGRRQLKLFPPEQLSQMGQVAYQEINKNTQVVQDRVVNNYVTCVVRAVASSLPRSVNTRNWKVTVYKDDSVNAFALPGGYIGVYTGLLDVTENQAQLAAVIGHEIAHVTADHHNARLSTHYATQTGLGIINAFISGSGGSGSRQIMSLLGLGAQVGILLPYSRSQEQEADILGLRYMAGAGFDPRESIELWKNMAESGGPRPPQFLSTHPAGQSRIDVLHIHMPEAMQLYDQALSVGRRPSCRAK